MFREFVNSDNVVKTGANEYKTQCTLYRKKFTLLQLRRYFKKEYEIFAQ